MTKQRWLGVALGVMVFLIAFGLALAQQLFQVSRTVPADLEVFDTTVLPDGQLQLEFRDGVQVEFLGFRRFQIQPPLRQFNEDAAGTRRIFARNATEPPIRLRLFDPCRPAVDSNTGQEIGFFVADLHGGNIWWDEQAGRWNDDDREWAGNTCDPGNERPEGKAFVMPGQTFTMDIRLELNEAYRNIDPTTIALEPVVIGGVGREVLGPAPIQPPAGMVGWWPGDGNAEDIIGGNHGTLTGDFVEGMVQQGFGLDGVSDHILVSDSADLNITGDVTVDLWAKRTVFGEGYTVMVGKGADYVAEGHTLYDYGMFFLTGDELVVGFSNEDGSAALLIGPTVRDTDFHHYAYVRSGDTHELFMDGRVATIATFEAFADGLETIGDPSDPFTARPGDTSGLPFVIGAFREFDESGFCCRFGGVIDEVEVFNRALTAEEIRAIYNAGSAGKIKPQPPQPIPPPEGMVSWWPGDGNAEDIIGGNNGTLVGDTGFAAGMVLQGFVFDGDGDYVTMGDVLDVGVGSFSIDLWYKASRSSAGGVNWRLASKGLFLAGTPPDSGYGFQLFDGELNFTVSDEGEVHHVPVRVPEPSPGEFHHLAGVLDKDQGIVKLYVDGELVGQSSFEGLGSLDTNLPLTFGHGVGGGNDFFEGQIDEVEFFDRALTTEEIRAIYNAGSAGKIKPQGGQIRGRKFWDQNGNGQWDAGEPPLGGWVIYLDLNDDGNPDMVTATNDDGGYWFMNVPEGEFGIWEEPQPGWVQTWPSGDGIYHHSLGRNEVADGLDFGNHLTAAEIHGVKFRDRNNNGQWDQGDEEGLPGWEIVLDLDQDGTGDMITTTDRNGEYWFMDLPSGPFDLWEVLQPGWVQTFHDAGIYSDTIQTGEILGLIFGNYLTAAELHGVKFNDRNNNGQWDEGEEGLPGWEIVLDLDQDGTGDRTTTTNRWGEYSFMDLPAGTFDLWEVQQPGWVQTMPEGGIHIPNIQIREIQRHFHFGNHLTAAEIHGRKYNDLNNSGGWDEGEPFLEGWEIALDLNNDGTADTVTTTNEFGAYWFMDLPNGPFTLWEVVQEGWAVTEPASGMHTGDLNAGDILRGMLFGNYQSGPALPDLTITLGALRGHYPANCDGGNVQCFHDVTFTVHNSGGPVVGSFSVAWVLQSASGGDPTGFVDATRSVQFHGFAANDSQTRTSPIETGQDCFLPACLVTIGVDTTETVAESNEANNEDVVEYIRPGEPPA